jgi:hypothetical protein
MQHVLAEVHFSKVFKNKMSVELPLSTKIFPMTHPAIFTSMIMASLWFVDFNLKSSSVKVIGTLPILVAQLDRH